MRKLLKKVVMFSVAAIAALTITTQAKASDYTLMTNNAWIDGMTSDDQSDKYIVTINEPGWLTVIAQSSSSSSYFGLYDNDMVKEYYSHSYYDGSETEPVTKEIKMALDPGVYVVKLGNARKVMKYKVKASFEPSGSNETGDNNSFDKAMKTKLNKKINGFLTEDNKADFYKVTLTRSATLRSIVNSKSMYGITYSLWDSDLVKLYSDWFSGEGQTRVFENEVAAGTYYIKIESGRTGAYTLKSMEWKYVTGIKLKKAVFKMNKGTTLNVLKSVSPSSASNKKLSWESSDTSVATVTSTGKVKGKKAGLTTITVKTTDGSDITAKCSIVVLPSKTQIKTCKLKSGLSAYVAVKTQSDISGYEYQLCRNSAFKGNKSTYSTDSYTRNAQTDTLRKQTQYYFRVRSYIWVSGSKYYGAWSDTKTLKTGKKGGPDHYCTWKDV